MKTILQICAFFAIVFGVIWFSPSPVKNPAKTGDGTKKLSRTLAEGLSYHEGSDPFPRALCDACRVGKVKVGIFSLSAFNTIEFDNLVVNIPEDFDISPKQKESAVHVEDSVSGGEMATMFDPRPFLSMSGISTKRKFHGIKINGFSINAVRGGTLSPVVNAGRLRNSGTKIILENVAIYDDGFTTRVDRANLKLKPYIAISWIGGEKKINRPALH